MVNLSYNGCLIFFIFVCCITPITAYADPNFVTSDSECFLNSFSICSDISEPKQFEMNLPDSVNSILLVPIYYTGNQGIVSDVFIDNQPGCSSGNEIQLTFLDVVSRTESRKKFNLKLFYISSPPSGQQYICADFNTNPEGSAMGGFYYNSVNKTNPINDYITIGQKYIEGAHSVTINNIDKGNAIFYTNILSPPQVTNPSQERYELNSSITFHVGDILNPTIPTETLEWSSNQSIYEFGAIIIELNGLKINATDSISITDSLNVSVERQKDLVESISFSDSISLEYHPFLSLGCFDYWLLGVLEFINPTCLIWVGEGGNDAYAEILFNNGSRSLITTVCNADNYAIIDVQIFPNKECYWVFGSDFIIWSKNPTAIYIPSFPPPPVPPPIIVPSPVGTIAPEPAKTIQKSSGSSSGGGRINLDVSSYTSLDRLAIWLADENYFKIAVRDLISQDLVDLKQSQVKNPPAWFYTTVEFWNTDQISDEEFFAALEFILK